VKSNNSKFTKRKNRTHFLYRAYLCFLLLLLLTGAEQVAYSANRSKTVVLDPGHGGHIHGAHSPTGKTEKNVALTTSIMTTKYLEKEFTTVATRTGDYHVPLARRIEIAHLHNTDVFISLHSGTNETQNNPEINIFYYKSQKFDKPENLESQRLASVLKQYVGRLPGIHRVNIFESQVAILAELEAPGVLIETGDITSIQAGKAITDDIFINKFSKKLAEGIEEFLKN
jgi:N-acetylmuramoyl-L-alanine amidase